MKNILFLIITCISTYGNAQNCNTLPTKFISFNQAIGAVENSIG